MSILTSRSTNFNWNSVYEQGADGNFAWQTSVERTPMLYHHGDHRQRRRRDHHLDASQRAVNIRSLPAGKMNQGNAISSAGYLCGSARATVAICRVATRENNDRIDLIADKKSYKPGDTAKLLVASPFTGTVKALMTIERSGVIESKVLDLTGNSNTLEIPITEEHIPNIFVSVVLVKGIDEGNPIPAMRIGYAQLNVDTAAKR